MVKTLNFVKLCDIYKNTAEDVETRFDTPTFEIDTPLPKEKSKKSNWANEKCIRWTNHERIC